MRQFIYIHHLKNGQTVRELVNEAPGYSTKLSITRTFHEYETGWAVYKDGDTHNFPRTILYSTLSLKSIDNSGVLHYETKTEEVPKRWDDDWEW